MQAQAWHYVGESTPQRISALENSLPNTELSGVLKNGLTLQCFHPEPRTDDTSYVRAVFCGTVSPDLFDWFFNSSTGYRGAFFQSPEAGDQANRLLVDQLSDFLADWAVTTQTDADRAWILASLAKPSAKAWLAEDPGLCARCKGEWDQSHVSDLQIKNSRWELASHVHAEWGRQAPCLSKIRIFGGFINAQQQEWIAQHKSDRAFHIWKHGWS
ncbi:hypothetical protein [Pseudomonas sp. G5(2012)]|uniref:hypothetical protein n=1 Tax=Pseudomonas sp. G5(2012) TaxID=1268068 RepID=UPI0005B4CD2D|nr:hypothetical protein [Pseudomonas sp. G5(2012)]